MITTFIVSDRHDDDKDVSVIVRRILGSPGSRRAFQKSKSAAARDCNVLQFQYRRVPKK
jgi:hypothetical protein